MSEHLTNSYGPAQAELVSGQGCYVWDATGKRYLDFLAGIAVNALGHAHPAFVAAVSEQAATLAHISNFFVSPPQLELARRLGDLLGTGLPTRTFFANSGAEANEAALKLARLHGKATGKPRILALEGGFHGRTFGALALTSNPQYREPFEPLPGGIFHFAPSLEALEAAMDDSVAAVFLEPIQGEVGVQPLPTDFLRAAREITGRFGALLVVDEVQTGIGRTGQWFAFQHAGITPDIVTLAKGLGGGIPIGACLAIGEVGNLFYPGSHGTTFGGNPLACRTALAVIDTISNDDLAANAMLRGEQLRTEILDLNSPLVEDVRGQGLLLGVVLKQPVAAQIVTQARGAGLILNAPRPNVVRLAPPLILGSEEVQLFLEIFANTLKDVGEELKASDTSQGR